MKKLLTNSERITVRQTNSFELYLMEVRKYELLDPNEEQRLATLMVQGDKIAKDKLIKHNLRFVISVAKQYYGTNVGIEDLVNEGNIGLIKATETFDPTKGFRFISYAVWWIRKVIIEFLNNKDEHIRIPVSRTYKIGKIREYYNALEQELQRPPTESELVNKINGKYEIDDVRLFYVQHFNKDEFLDDYVGDEGDSITKGDMLVNKTIPHTDVFFEVSDSNYRINRYLSYLKPNQREVIVKFFGLEGMESIPMEAISGEMGITKERVRQLKEESLRILHAKLKFNNLHV